MPTSGATWWRCGQQTFLPMIRRRLVGRGSGRGDEEEPPNYQSGPLLDFHRALFKLHSCRVLRLKMQPRARRTGHGLILVPSRALSSSDPNSLGRDWDSPGHLKTKRRTFTHRPRIDGLPPPVFDPAQVDRDRSAPSSASSTAMSATSRRCRACFLIIRPRWCATLRPGTNRAMMRWGMPPPPRAGGPAGHQRPRHVIAALARMACACVAHRNGYDWADPFPLTLMLPLVSRRVPHRRLDQKPPTARKPSRTTKEILKVIEEYAGTEREFPKALRWQVGRLLLDPVAILVTLSAKRRRERHLDQPLPMSALLLRITNSCRTSRQVVRFVPARSRHAGRRRDRW